MMGWIPNYVEDSVRRLAASVLKQGPVPKHVAFIMDGNRRWARMRNQETKIGHSLGFEKLKESLDWCLECGVQALTIYAFSIENFKRTKEEVDYLMELAKEKFQEMLGKEEIIEKHGVSVRVLGDLSLLPPAVQEVMAKVVYNSRHNDRAILNVCFSYTSRQEIYNSIREIGAAIVDCDDEISLNNGSLLDSDLTEELFERCLYTGDVDHTLQTPELLIRTSGESRLSDFLLWQCSQSSLVFLSVLWPDFSAWHFYYSILLYQRDYPQIQERRKEYLARRDALQNEADTALAMKQLMAESNVDSYDSLVLNEENQSRLRELVAKIKADRAQRVSVFLRKRDLAHLKQLQSLIGIREEVTLP
eukprot:TRINITY_DN9028_c0_g1_i1.p1 TRINITY_DN9028_c0_g1~~TRINITY_DN9028_c0_g1_i1.p1  ORF type:complete len:361 (-),score=58.71 TRINITY_DN9028_c0_g1_i1:80-1162(-)